MPGTGAVGRAAERRHVPDPVTREWEERWWFDFATADGSLAGYARLALRAGERVAWWWAAVVGESRPLVTVRAHDIRIPAQGTEVRTDGVWACLTCEEPDEHWSVGLEAFGVALDDPLEAWGDERGDVVPFGLDLEWEAAAPVEPLGPHSSGRQSEGYAQCCTVHGDVLIGDERIEVDASGHREHAWGVSELARFPGWRVSAPGVEAGPLWGRSEGLGGGSEGLGGGFEGLGGGSEGLGGLSDELRGRSNGLTGLAHEAVGGWARLAGDLPRPSELLTEWGADGLPQRATATVEAVSYLVEPVSFAPVAVPGMRVVHALCRVQGRPGHEPTPAWVSWWR